MLSTSSVSLSSSSPRSLVSSRFIQAHFASRRSTHFEFVVAGGAYGPFSIGLTCSVSPYLTADVVLGLDWQRGLREWFSRGPGHGQSNNLDVSSFLHAPSPTSSSVLTPPPTPTEAAQNVPNAASLIGAGSLPTSVTLASMASVGPTVSTASSSSMSSIYPITRAVRRNRGHGSTAPVARLPCRAVRHFGRSSTARSRHGYDRVRPSKHGRNGRNGIHQIISISSGL